MTFAERSNYLLEADLAVCTVPQGLENSFAFRTRLVDAVWAGVPIVCTREGFFAEYVEQKDIGLTVRSGDVAEVKSSLLRALRPEMQARFRTNLAACYDDLRWDRCVQPLRDFCRSSAHEQIVIPHSPYLPTAPCMAYQIFSDVSGVSRCRTPKPASASSTALATAAGAGTVDTDPIPLAPSGLVGDGTSTVSRIR